MRRVHMIALSKSVEAEGLNDRIKQLGILGRCFITDCSDYFVTHIIVHGSIIHVLPAPLRAPTTSFFKRDAANKYRRTASCASRRGDTTTDSYKDDVAL